MDEVVFLLLNRPCGILGEGVSGIPRILGDKL
jgi:hypothetical protein